MSLSCVPSPSSALILHLLLPLFLILIKTPHSVGEYYYSNCTETFSCGDVVGVGYPFWGGSRASFCGYPELELKCENGSTATMVIQEVKYRVLGVYPNPIQVLRIARDDYMQGLCSTNFLNTTLDSSLFQIADGYTDFTLLYGCQTVSPLFSCPVQGVPYTGGYYVFSGLGVPIGSCFKSVVVPLSLDFWSTLGNSSSNLVEVLQHGFEVQLKVDGEACGECTQSFGVCGYDLAANQTTCYCPGQSFGSKTCGSSISAAPLEATTAKSTQGRRKVRLKIGIGIAASGAGIGIALILMLLCMKKPMIRKITAFIKQRKMVGKRKNIEVMVDHTSEIYFPHWVYQRLELQGELGLRGITNEEDEGIAKKMIIISLWCIQIDPRARPSMTHVVKMLEGSVEALQVPPKPAFSSPPKIARSFSR
ncbi:hypothetical protein NL676_029355 [Syzygium grande]|nr:hypothetical protein NL676_029355 [Syzygium grande]